MLGSEAWAAETQGGKPRANCRHHRANMVFSHNEMMLNDNHPRPALPKVLLVQGQELHAVRMRDAVKLMCAWNRAGWASHVQRHAQDPEVP